MNKEDIKKLIKLKKEHAKCLKTIADNLSTVWTSMDNKVTLKTIAVELATQTAQRSDIEGADELNEYVYALDEMFGDTIVNLKIIEGFILNEINELKRG